MNDLISRNALLEMLNYNKAIHEDESGETRQLIAIDINKMIDYVKKMPTAYDVDKVVEQLMNKHCGNCSNFISKGLLDKDYCRHAKCDIYDICEIVKTGGRQCQYRGEI